MADARQQFVTLHWRDIVVTTEDNRVLLRGISGIVSPGEMCALMGASGAGKTTLLNALLHRNTAGLAIKGHVYANGQEIGISAYVQQEDLFVGSLTVREHLHLQALMRLPSHSTKAERNERVEEVLSAMLLESARDSRIGTPAVKKGISGGEMKRLAFASALLSKPSILFCDEPTTGLDSHMALLVIKQLEALAHAGMTIVCTIHQPNPEIFEIFDKLVFLSVGRIAYIGAPCLAPEFFASVGFLIPEHHNPANYFIHVLAVDPDHAEDCKTRNEKICDAFLESPYYEVVLREMRRSQQKLAFKASAPVPIAVLTLALWRRYIIDNARNPSVVVAKFVQKAFMAIFLGLLYLKHWTHNASQGGLTNIKGALFYYISELTYSTMFGIQTYLPGDFPLLVREYHDGIYPASAYYIARILSYLPIFSIDGAILISISYWMIGFAPSFVSFLLALLIALLIELSSASLGIMVASVTPSYSIAVAVTGPILTLFSLTGGIFTNVEAMPPWISWVQYLSWFRYGYEALIINEMSDARYDNISCIASKSRFAHFPNRTITEQYCLHNGQERSNMPLNLIVMPLYVLAVYTIGYIGLAFRVQRAR